jgi:hypothetical protein
MAYVNLRIFYSKTKAYPVPEAYQFSVLRFFCQLEYLRDGVNLFV